jgi:hypothetical protein
MQHSAVTFEVTHLQMYNMHNVLGIVVCLMLTNERSTAKLINNCERLFMSSLNKRIGKLQVSQEVTCIILNVLWNCASHISTTRSG